MLKQARDKIDLWVFERDARTRGHVMVAGIDEAGRGPLAGPVVAAAVILPPDEDIEGVFDSKQLTAEQRDECFERIQSAAAYIGIGIVGHKEIDRINILQASYKAMHIAVRNMGVKPDLCLIDGSPIATFRYRHECIVDGDCKSISIAAASIVAKVTRDRIMCEYARKYPKYGFENHKGYSTPEHRECLMKHGVCAIHRRSFAPVAEELYLLWERQDLRSDGMEKTEPSDT